VNSFDFASDCGFQRIKWFANPFFTEINNAVYGVKVGLDAAMLA